MLNNDHESFAAAQARAAAAGDEHPLADARAHPVDRDEVFPRRRAVPVELDLEKFRADKRLHLAGGDDRAGDLSAYHS